LFFRTSAVLSCRRTEMWKSWTIREMLEYVALALLLLSITALFYLFIFIHDLPYRTAKQRNHPQQEAIHYACWLSLFTLHAIWPLVYLWAVMDRKAPLTGSGADPGAAPSPDLQLLAALEARIAALETAALETAALESAAPERGPTTQRSEMTS